MRFQAQKTNKEIKNKNAKSSGGWGGLSERSHTYDPEPRKPQHQPPESERNYAPAFAIFSVCTHTICGRLPTGLTGAS